MVPGKQGCCDAEEIHCAIECRGAGFAGGVHQEADGDIQQSAADADGPCWTDAEIADAYGCRTKTVENIRERFVTEGFAVTLNGQERKKPPRPNLLDSKQEAKVIALRLEPPPKGYSNWTLRLLARRVVELGIVDTISYETVRRTLKKTKSRTGRSSTG